MLRQREVRPLINWHLLIHCAWPVFTCLYDGPESFVLFIYYV